MPKRGGGRVRNWKADNDHFGMFICLQTYFLNLNIYINLLSIVPQILHNLGDALEQQFHIFFSRVIYPYLYPYVC